MTDFQTANAIVDEHYPAGESIRFAWAIDAVMAAIKAEREACAKVCDDFGDDYMVQAREGDSSGASDHKACAAVEIADEIRARGDAP